MKTIDFEAYRQRLLDEKAEAATRLASHNGAFQRSITSEPYDSFDAAQEQTDYLIEDSIANLEDKRLEAVDDALHRLIDGAYGQCEDCSKPIAKERLDALPKATLCVQCQAQREGFGPLRLFSA
jgi:DnaK suppressor protein